MAKHSTSQQIIGVFDEELAPRIQIASASTRFSVVVDTGFNGELMLPRAVLHECGFVYSMKSEAELADGTVVEATLYSGVIHWFGEARSVQAMLTDSKSALLGTEMFFGLTVLLDLDEKKVVLEKKE